MVKYLIEKYFFDHGYPEKKCQLTVSEYQICRKQIENNFMLNKKIFNCQIIRCRVKDPLYADPPLTNLRSLWLLK